MFFFNVLNTFAGTAYPKITPFLIFSKDRIIFSKTVFDSKTCKFFLKILALVYNSMRDQQLKTVLRILKNQQQKIEQQALMDRQFCKIDR